MFSCVFFGLLVSRFFRLLCQLCTYMLVVCILVLRLVCLGLGRIDDRMSRCILRISFLVFLLLFAFVRSPLVLCLPGTCTRRFLVALRKLSACVLVLACICLLFLARPCRFTSVVMGEAGGRAACWRKMRAPYWAF